MPHTSSQYIKHEELPQRPKRTAPSEIITRGRPQARRTSAERVGQNRRARKVLSRKPLTPTTRTAMLKERRFQRLLKKRREEAEMEKVLSRADTYWMILRSGKRRRVLGGTRAR